MTAATEPRLTGGAIVSVLLHGGLIAAFFVLHAAPPPQGSPIYSVRLIAGPAAPATTVDAAPPAPKPAPVEKAAAPPPTPPKKSVPVKKAKAATPTPPIPSQTAPPKASAAAPPSETPPASALSTGGKGSDVANVSTGGVEFPYPYYTNRIVNEILKRFPQQRIALVASVRFVIRRDGSVDPASIQLEERSASYQFNMQAMGAVEAAANAKVFGALPSGYQDDILPITFRFSPSLVK